MYELTNVRKTYAKGRSSVTALDDVSLSIDRGAFLAIQGPTGHGKTTLLQLLGGLDRPTAGSIEFDGRNLGTMREASLADLRSRSFGFVFQTFNLIPTLTAEENVAAALVPQGRGAGERRTRARDALAELGLEDRATHLPGELSGGQQQRVAIARALVAHPDVILADEPTGNLDEGTRDEILDLLVGLWRDRGQTLVIVTHDSAVARRAERRIWLSHGRIGATPGGDAPAQATPES